MRALISLLLLLHPILGFSSELYDSLGHLKRDPAYQITARQLKRWGNVEPLLFQYIFKNFRYPQYERECGIGCKMLLALSVDTGGNIVAVSMANFADSSASNKPLGRPDVFFRQMNLLLLAANFKNELRYRPYPGKYTQTYYLPFYASVGTKQQQHSGWLYFVVEEPISRIREEYIICRDPGGRPYPYIVSEVKPTQDKKLFRRKRDKVQKTQRAQE